MYVSYDLLREENGEDTLILLRRFETYVFSLFETYYRNF